MPRFASVTFNPDEPMPPQTADWTCAACSLAWLNRALYIDHATDEWAAVDYIGNPENINQQYGLMDGSGRVLADRLIAQGAPAWCCWPSWDEVYQLSGVGALLIGGGGWYHWVGVRAPAGANLLIANSAPGWGGVWDSLASSDWQRLGPFAAVFVPVSTQFPPPPEA